MTGVPDPKGDAADSWVESVRLRRLPRRAGALSFSAGEYGAPSPDPGHRARNYPGIQFRSRIGVAALMGCMSAARRSIPPHPSERAAWSSIKLWAWVFGSDSSVADGIACGTTGAPVGLAHCSREGDVVVTSVVEGSTVVVSRRGAGLLGAGWTQRGFTRSASSLAVSRSTRSGDTDAVIVRLQFPRPAKLSAFVGTDLDYVESRMLSTSASSAVPVKGNPG
jgi:hypothetical protein